MLQVLKPRTFRRLSSAMTSLKRPLEEEKAPSEVKAAKMDNESGPNAPELTDGSSVQQVAPPATDTSKEVPNKQKGKHDASKSSRGKGRGGSNRGARSGNWEPRQPREGEDAGDREPRLPKKKVALLMSFCGTGYQGMQINPGARSIEGDLWKALVEANAISKDNSDDPKKVSFVRAARTDKGVHALGQVCSLKMSNIDDPEIIAKINANLPDQIRVWGIVRTIKSFNAKNICDSRIYEYLMPTHVFIPPHPEYYPESQVAADPAGAHPRFAFPSPEGIPFAGPDQFRTYFIPASTEEEMSAKRDFRIGTQQLDALRAVLASYVGTKNFHNYTVGKKFQEPNALRYIISFTCSDPFVKDGMEWVSLKIKGQSFMLHQIRKMVGMAISLVRTGTPLSLLKNTFTSTRFNIPKAPALGLLLRQVVYDKYNQRQRETNKHFDSQISFEPYEKAIEDFKDRHITSAMVREELRARVFDDWIRIIDSHAAEVRWYLKKDGSFDESQRPTQSQVDALDKEEDEAEAGADDDGSDGEGGAESD